MLVLRSPSPISPKAAVWKKHLTLGEASTPFFAPLPLKPDFELLFNDEGGGEFQKLEHLAFQV